MGILGTKLTKKQQAFCDYYIESLNATEAAKRAGYSNKTAKEMGSENLTKPHLREYIDRILAKKDRERIADQDEVLELLTSIARGEETEEVIFSTMAGIKRLKKAASLRDRIKAAELLGKRYALFTDKIEQSGPTEIVLKLPTKWEKE